MKIVLITFVVFFSLGFISCDDTEYNSTEFLVSNKCSYTIDLYTSAIVRSNSGSNEVTIHDVIATNQVLSLRTLSVSDKFDIDDVFTKIEIYNGTIKSDMNARTLDLWTLTDANEYTLNVDTTFFR